MDHTPDRDGHRPPLGIALTAGAALCLVAGSISVIDAVATWQDVLTYFAGTRSCAQNLAIPGWGEGFVIACTSIALILLAATARAMLGPRRWGHITALLALALVACIWLDTYAAGAAPSSDCDAIGMGGAASTAINRAGWFLMAASVLGGLAWAWLSAKLHEFPAPSRITHLPR